MKREGKQHGMVRNCIILPEIWHPTKITKVVNQFDSPSTAGISTKVSAKPTNHSKYTGKCGRPRCRGCHDHPTCKYPKKTKGGQKLRPSDVANGLISWRVVGKWHGGNYSGISATTMLGHLSNNYSEEDEIEDYIDRIDDDSPALCEEIGYEGIKIEDGGGDEDDEDDHMSFCDVGFVVEQVDGDEGWSLVDEL